MKTLRYALIGTGMMGHEHMRNLALLRDLNRLPVQIVALVDPDQSMRESALELARELGFADVIACEDLSEVAMETVDACVVASPNHTHRDVVGRLLSHGKAILAEKPMCTTLAHCDELLHQLKDYPAPFWVAMEYRYMPPTARFIERLGRGDVGKLHMLTIREHRFPFLQKVENWNRFSENTGGTLVEKCCHHFDLMRLMTGAEPVRIFASGAMDVNHLDEQYDGRRPDIIDNALVIIDFDSGCRASLELCMFADRAEPQEQLTALGNLGKLDACIPGPERFWPDEKERHAQVVFRPRGSLEHSTETIKVDARLAAAGDHHGSTYYQHVKFAAAVLDGAEVEVNAEDGLKAVRMGLAAQESIRTAQVVEF